MTGEILDITKKEIIPTDIANNNFSSIHFYTKQKYRLEYVGDNFQAYKIREYF